MLAVISADLSFLEMPNYKPEKAIHASKELPSPLSSDD